MQQQLQQTPEKHETQQSQEIQQSQENHINPVSKSLDIPGYRFIRELGHGAQGQVFLAERLADHTSVAIKKLNIDNVKNWKEYELFHREAETLASLNVDGVAHFYEAIERLEDNPPCSYIVQEYIDGKSLNDMLHVGHRFSLDVVYDIIMQLVSILYDLHTHEPPVIHRDIKPSNILLKRNTNQSGRRYDVYLIDFGAVANPQVQGGGSTIAGTFGYMPPEQLMGKPTPASDIYSLAAVAVYMMSGKSPADMPVKDFHLIFEPDLQNMPPSVVNTLRSMLEPAPEKRLCDYEMIYNLFEAFQNDIYDYTGSRQKKMSINAYNEQLAAVDYFGQNDNIELWQELPDELPRDDIYVPSCYKYLKSDRELYSDGVSLFETSSFSITGYELKNDLRELVVSVFGFLGVLLVMALIILFFVNQVVVTILVSSVFLILFIAVILEKLGLTDRVKKRMSVRYYIKTPKINNIEKQHLREVRELLLDGRKTIAKIVSIEYIKQKPAYVERNLVGTISKKLPHTYARYVTHSAPVFRIFYAFNPPDDEREDDLVQFVDTNIEPENHYKVGDPFPILYRIYRLSEKVPGGRMANNEYVDSMPFPLPINHIIDYHSMLFHAPDSWLLDRESVLIKEYEEMARRKRIHENVIKERQQQRERKFKKLEPRKLFVTDFRNNTTHFD